jgi:hypothetical protein
VGTKRFDNLPYWLIRLDRGLRSGDLDVAAEAVAELRKIGVHIRIDLSSQNQIADLPTIPTRSGREVACAS